MRFYLQFLLCLVVGLFGLCAALKILFDTLMLNWDPVDEIRASLDPSRRRRAIAQWQLGRTLQDDDV